jgi:signal transduction histidine kinase
MRNFLGSLSLKTRIVLTVLVLLAAGIWGMALRVTAILYDELQTTLSGQMSATVNDIVVDLERDIGMLMEALSRVGKALPPDTMRAAPRVQRFLEQHTALAVLFPGGVLAADRNGVIRAAQPPLDTAAAPIAEPDQLRDLMAKGAPAIVSPSAGRRLRPAAIIVPLRDATGAPVGALIGLVELSAPFLLGQFEKAKLGSTGYFVIVTRKDRVVITAPQASRIGTRLPGKGVIADLDRRLEEGFEGSAITVTATGDEVLAVSKKIAMTDWVMLAGVPVREIFAPIAKLRREVYMTALLISIAIAAVLGFVLAFEFRRLDRAAEAMRRMSEGEAPFAAIPVMRDDEIGRLEDNFNQLMAERNRLDEALRSEIEAHKRAEAALEDAMRRLQALTERMTQTQEEERRSLAFELHEKSGQELSALAMHLQMLEAQLAGNEAQARLEDARAIAAMALERVRALSAELHPTELDQFGLYSALRAHCRKHAAQAGWVLHFDAPEGAARPSREVELACFRVAESALDNVARHARAAHVWVSLHRARDELRLTVRDDGIGFEPGDANRRSGPMHLGLVAMQERIRQVGGRLEVRPSPGSGTQVLAAFPVGGA